MVRSTESEPDADAGFLLSVSLDPLDLEKTAKDFGDAQIC